MERLGSADGRKLSEKTRDATFNREWSSPGPGATFFDVTLITRPADIRPRRENPR